MLYVPQKGRIRIEHNWGSVGSIDIGTSVAGNAGSTSTKGTPVQVFAATAFDAYWIEILAHKLGSSALDTRSCLDILIGAATEDVLIPNLLAGYAAGAELATTNGLGIMWAFPLYIPAGSRIAVQQACQSLGRTMKVGITLYGGHGYPMYRVGRKVTTYGITTVPTGTTIVPGASGAAGSMTQIVASTTEDHFAVCPSFQISGDTTVAGGMVFLGALGIGAATEDEVGRWGWRTSSVETMCSFGAVAPVFMDIPSGTRLAMRVSNSGANDSGYNAAIHAVS